MAKNLTDENNTETDVPVAESPEINPESKAAEARPGIIGQIEKAVDQVGGREPGNRIADPIEGEVDQVGEQGQQEHSNAYTGPAADDEWDTRETQDEGADPSRNISRLLDVEMNVTVRFGKTMLPLREVVNFGVGSMIELNRNVDEPVELLVNNFSFARGEVVVIDGYYGVKITEIGTPEERSATLFSGARI